MITTTLNKIREHSPCQNGWGKLLKHLGKTKADDEPLPFAVIVESNGIEDALWCCRSAPEYDKEWRLFAVWCARQVQHLMTDPRSVAALDIAERSANGEVTTKALDAAWAAARAAALDADRDAAGAAAGAAARAAALDAAGDAAWDAAGAAARAAARDAAKDAAGAAAWAAARAAALDADRDAAGDAAWDAAGAAARDAAGAAAWAEAWDAARAAAWDADWAAAWDAARAAQTKRFLEVVS